MLNPGGKQNKSETRVKYLTTSSSNSKKNDLRRVADGAEKVLLHPPADAPPTEAVAAAEHVPGLAFEPRRDGDTNFFVMI